MARARICILLSIGLLSQDALAQAGRVREAAPLVGAASLHDSSRVFITDVQSHGRPRQLRRPYGSRALRRITAIQESGSGPARADEYSGRASAAVGPAVDQRLCGADGDVLGIARSGNTLYIAGAFRSVGENSGGCVPFDAATGQPLGPFPKVAGTVYAIVPDGSGGWFIGGEFSGVGGKPRSCLAQIRADGSVSDWSPSVTGSPDDITPPAVMAIAVRGNQVFVGGADFRRIGGMPRMNLGCVDARTGAVLDWVADTEAGGYVWALALHGDTLLVGGGYSSLGGVSRSSLAAVSAATGEILGWQMDVFGGAYALKVCGDTLYVGGDFIGIGGRAQPVLAAIDLPRASLLPIDFHVDGVHRDYLPVPQVDGLAMVGDTLYTVGNFTQIGGQIRSGIAAVNAKTGEALAWSPDTTGLRYEGFPPMLSTSVAVAGGTVYVGGYFEYVEGIHHPFVAAWNGQSGGVLDWDPTPNDAVLAIATSGDTVYVGGYFQMVGGWRHRAGLAAIDLITGRPKTWNPNPDGQVCTAIAVKGDRVLVSGDFATIGGIPQARNYFAALDTVNGEALDWNPGANALAEVLRCEGDTLYAGGEFTEIGGLVRSHVAAIDLTTGAVTEWDPDASWPVFAMARRGDAIYLGGIFTQMAGQPRAGMAEVDAFTGALSPWNPNMGAGLVNALLLDGSTLYVGGGFGQIGGELRNAIAALDLTTAAATSWYPGTTAWDIQTQVRALAKVGGELYVGGNFGTIGGQSRVCLAAVDTLTGAATDWDPGTNGPVWSVTVAENVIYVGGGFTRAGGAPAVGLAAFALAPPPPARPPGSLTLSQSAPNPVRTSATIQFRLPHPATVSLAVYDVRGRRIAVPLNDALLNAGQQSVEIRTGGWPPGVYLYCLEAGRERAMRKLVVVR